MNVGFPDLPKKSYWKITYFRKKNIFLERSGRPTFILKVLKIWFCTFSFIKWTYVRKKNFFFQCLIMDQILTNVLMFDKWQILFDKCQIDKCSNNKFFISCLQRYLLHTQVKNGLH